MSTDLVYAIHGFLGQSSDWDRIKKFLPELNFITEDLFSFEAEKGTERFNQHKGKKIFLGYSLGGRLGLQIFKKSPGLFDHYIFLSTNPGFLVTDINERKNRLLSDLNWAKKISQKNWAVFLKEWNEQSVFQGSGTEPERNINQYDLIKLQEGIVKWSLGSQEDFSELIKKNNSKITWVVGDQDKKYCEIAEKMKVKEILEDYKIISSGHRIWLDNPEAVVELIKQTN